MFQRGFFISKKCCKKYPVDHLERKSSCFDEEESELFIEVDCFNVEPVFCPAPDDLTQQQVQCFLPICLISAGICHKENNSQQSVSSLYSWWEDASWVLSWRVRRTILMHWKGYWRYAHRAAAIERPVTFLSVFFFLFICFISTMRNPCPRLSQGCWVTGSWK